MIYNATGFFIYLAHSKDGRKSSESNAHLEKQSITIKKLTTIKFFNRTSIIFEKGSNVVVHHHILALCVALQAWSPWLSIHLDSQRNCTLLLACNLLKSCSGKKK
jgi:hypothetical protein